MGRVNHLQFVRRTADAFQHWRLGSRIAHTNRRMNQPLCVLNHFQRLPTRLKQSAVEPQQIRRNKLAKPFQDFDDGQFQQPMGGPNQGQHLVVRVGADGRIRLRWQIRLFQQGVPCPWPGRVFGELLQLEENDPVHRESNGKVERGGGSAARRPPGALARQRFIEKINPSLR